MKDCEAVIYTEQRMTKSMQMKRGVREGDALSFVIYNSAR